MAVERQSNEKARELVVYVCRAMRDVESFGQVLLNKVLFFAEAMHVVEHGTSITGARYTRQPQGPVLHQMKPIQRELSREGVLDEREEPVAGYTRRRPVMARDADLSLFSRQELETVDATIATFSRYTAAQASAVSHMLPGWQLSVDRELIPLETTLLTGGPITDTDRVIAERLAARHR